MGNIGAALVAFVAVLAMVGIAVAFALCVHYVLMHMPLVWLAYIGAAACWFTAFYVAYLAIDYITA
jgi:hypothetical protein